MKEESAPKVDGRSAQDVSRQLRKLLAAHAPPWPAEGGGKLGDAMIGIFSRFAEIIIQRLNQTPEKNLLAYLDLLGLSMLPPQPARVPLTFFLAAGSLTDAVVPAGTQVAAKPVAGETEPVVFETEKELTVVAARLAAAFTRDPGLDKYASQVAVIGDPAEAGADIFSASELLEHVLYVGHEKFLSHAALTELRVRFVLKQGISNPQPRQVTWEFWDGAAWAEVRPKPSGGGETSATGFVEDLTENLTRGGDVVFTRLPNVSPLEVGGRTGRWLRARLTTAVPPAQFGPAASPAQLPTVNSVTLSASLERSPDVADTATRPPLDAAYVNFAPADTSKSFFPFGERPRVGDTLYLAQSEALSGAGATVTLDVNLTRPLINPATNQPYLTPTAALAWEFWDGRGWALLFNSYSNGVVAPAGQGFSDTTNAFTKSGRVRFTLTRQPARTTVGGVENYWVRVRIVSGDYGRDAYYTLKDGSTTEYRLVPATFSPPTVDSLSVGYTATLTEPPDALLTYNDFTFKAVAPGTAFEPFRTTENTPVSFFVGLTLPEGRRAFPNRVVSLYVRMQPYLYGLKPDAEAPSAPPRLNWQYWDGAAWSKLTVFDGTADLTRDGLLEFLAPPDFAPRREFGAECYWVRVVWDSGEYQFRPRVRALLLNTTTAAQTLTVLDENLGSSDAGANQKFVTTAAPVLPGQRLEVREPDRPAAEEWASIESEEGADAITVTLDERERPAEIWVRWHEVPDFYGSGARDRHYVINRLTGEITFGDGNQGMIPPRGAGNLRLSFYRTGGGRAGNRAAGTITEMKTTVPYVDSVTNAVAAEGGAEAESRDTLIRRGPRSIRHRGRAVTAQDYEDLAMLASAGVARVKSIPLQDLAAGIDLKQPKVGVVTLIVVPHSTDARPYPDVELLDEVRDYLDRRRAADARLVIVGPEYVRVVVRAEVVPASTEVVGRLEEEIAAALARFLHPLTGGSEGSGWNFGRKPYPSDLYAVIESVAGVAYVRKLVLEGSTEVNGVEKPVDFEKLPDGQRYFLVYSGEHEIDLVFD